MCNWCQSQDQGCPVLYTKMEAWKTRSCVIHQSKLLSMVAQFSQNDDLNTGNFVYLMSESGCPVHKDGSTENQVMSCTPE